VTHLRAFLAEEEKRRSAVSSQARTTAALKLFFRFLVEEERIARNPALPLRTPKKQETLPDTMTMASSSACSPRPAATTCGSGTSRDRRSAIGCCWRSWPTRDCAGASYAHELRGAIKRLRWVG
jgi:site-specific recombinase XerD